MTQMNKQIIVNMLATDDRAVARALLVLNQRQTAEEQATENTRYLNGRGFRPCHARMGTSMAKFFQRTGYLTPKQIAYWRAKDRSGSMRIGIYWAQLLEEAQAKAQRRAAEQRPVTVVTDGGRDLGNDMERRMVLQEQLGDVIDSDDPKLIDPIATEISEIDQFWAAIRAKQPK